MGDITLTEDEAVRRGGETYSIGDKVYSTGTGVGVGYIVEIRLYGVHFGFRAKLRGTILDEPKWVDSRNITKEIPLSKEQLETLEKAEGCS
ncbi:MAG: hypothetical protein ABEI52_03690 [Halobacteriaceae archaeon]